MTSIPSLIRHPGRILSGAGPQIVAAVDIGSVKTACMIAQWTPPKHVGASDVRQGLKVLGFGQTVSRGVKAGGVADIGETERSIRMAVDTAERMARTTVRKVHVNVSGGKPRTVVVNAAVNTETGVVSHGDVDACLTAAVGRADVGRRHVLHLLPVSYVLDGIETLQAPVGMHGQVLSCHVAVVTMDAAPLNNLRMAIERSHLSVAGFGLTPYAAAKSVLAHDERDLGTIMLDLGGATTSVAVFRFGKLVASAIIPIGGQHITNDIAQGLLTTVAHAERLKTLFGTVLANGHDDRELLAVPLLGERGVDTVQKVPKHVLTSIIVPRLDEVFDRVKQVLHDCFDGVPDVGRAVLTGGASQLHGMREFATSRLGLGVRIGLPTGFQGLPELASSGGFAAVAGLLVSAVEPPESCDMPQEAKIAIDRSQLTYARRVGQWLAEAF